MMKIYFKNNKGPVRAGGFTLIELLVVVAIISLLSSIVFASLYKAKMKGRDSKRIQDMVQIRNALALYASDNNGVYPAGNFNSTAISWGVLKNSNNLGPYINPLSVDPINNLSFFYFYTNAYSGTGTCSGKTLLIVSKMEDQFGRKDCTLSDDSYLNATIILLN